MTWKLGLCKDDIRFQFGHVTSTPRNRTLSWACDSCRVAEFNDLTVHPFGMWYESLFTLKPKSLALNPQLYAHNPKSEPKQPLLPFDARVLDLRAHVL